YPSTTVMLFRDFPDVFSVEFQEASRRYVQVLKNFHKDPYLIGYFMRNEPLWAFGRHNLAARMLEDNPGSATRRALAQWLQKRYGSIEALNKAWSVNLSNFDAFVTNLFYRVDFSSPKAAEDLWEFSKEMVRLYVAIPVQEARKVDPYHLILGMRYAWISSELLLVAGESFDVFSINCYNMEPCLSSIEQIAKATGKPVIIGEFHFGALDRGLPSTGLRAVTSQQERGIAYRRYVELAAANPNIVGVHYFTLNDQTVLGRFDGENYQIGFVDVCSKPYEELVEAAKQTNQRLYLICDGKVKPFEKEAQQRVHIAF
ncbi:MAG: beta-galactosidase, partial [candidate division WOR-3 bacterium]